jgi:hypothetical protein
MANLTSAQIKTILETASYPEDIEINGALLENDERRKYPSIDVQNITGDEILKEFPTTTLGQTFLIHLFYRYRSFGEQHESDIKNLEDVIFDTIDANSNFSTDVKVTVTQGWRRTSETFPVRRSHSVLTVSSEEISATDPATGATPGDKIEITIPSVGTFKVISIPIDQYGLIKQFDLTQFDEQIFTKIHDVGLLSVEMALSPTQENTLQSQIIIGDDVSISLDLNGTSRSLLVNYADITSSSSREVVRTTILTMDVKTWS